MKDLTKDQVRELWSTRNLSRVKAQEEYTEKTGRKLNDPAIYSEIEALLEKAIRSGKDNAVIPTSLLIAVALRSRTDTGGFGRPKKELGAVELKRRTIELAGRRWRERFDAGQPSKAAKEDAAQEAFEYGKGQIKLKAILKEMVRRAPDQQ